MPGAQTPTSTTIITTLRSAFSLLPIVQFLTRKDTVSIKEPWMTAATSSSRGSLEMSFSRSCTPTTGLSEAGEVDSGVGTQASSAERKPFQSSPLKQTVPQPVHRDSVSALPQAIDRHEDPNFGEIHLNSPEIELWYTTKDVKLIKAIRLAGKEEDIYQPCATLLTVLSRRTYSTSLDHSCLPARLLTTSLPTTSDSLSEETKAVVRQRHGVAHAENPHISFIDHHSCAPTCFPKRKLRDAPDILGVRDGETYPIHNPNGPEYEGVPHHCIDTIVEAKPVGSISGRSQGAAYAYRHLQARPDHPTILVLLVKPEGYQVLLSDANGIIASKRSPWDDLELLQAYLYSLYVPPSNHAFFDPSLSWYIGPDSAVAPDWLIKFNAGLSSEHTFRGSLHFTGSPWSRRTTIFMAKDEEDHPVIVKEYYRSDRRRFKEEDVLRQIHADGDVPGVVRLRCAEEVCVNGVPIQCGSEDTDLRTKV